MEAIIETGGKQYNVAVGDELKIERIDLEVGSNFEINKVLAILDRENTKLGSPLINNATVVCEILEHSRDEKIIIFKKRRRKNSRSKQGHRQNISFVKIKEIKA